MKSSNPCLVSKVPNITGMLASACTELLPVEEPAVSEEPDASLPLHDLYCLLWTVLFQAEVRKTSAWELKGA